MFQLLDYINKCGKYKVRGESFQIFQAFGNLIESVLHEWSPREMS